MGKLKKCKTCGAEIAKSAKSCPSCGARQHQGVGCLCSVVCFIAFIAIMSVIFSSGSDEGPRLAGSASSESGASSNVEEKTVFNVGEKVVLNNIAVTLVDVEESTGSQFNKPTGGNVFLLCEFEIENDSTADIAVSSLISFTAYVDDYSTAMNLSATIDSDKSQLDGTVAASKKMNGVIGYEVPSDWSELEIHYKPDFWSGKDITFVATK